MGIRGGAVEKSLGRRNTGLQPLDEAQLQTNQYFQFQVSSDSFSS